MVPARNCNVRVVTTVPTLRRARLVPQCNEASSPSTFIVHSCKLFLCWFLLMHKSCCDVSPPLAGRLYCVCGCVRAVVDVAVLPHPGTPPALQLGAAGLRGNKVLLSPPAPSQRLPSPFPLTVLGSCATPRSYRRGLRCLSQSVTQNYSPVPCDPWGGCSSGPSNWHSQPPVPPASLPPTLPHVHPEKSPQKVSLYRIFILKLYFNSIYFRKSTIVRVLLFVKKNKY